MVFPDANGQGPCFSFVHGYNHIDENAENGKNAVENSLRQAGGSLLDSHKELSMDYCYLSCKYASFPTSGAVDGSPSNPAGLTLSWISTYRPLDRSSR